MFSMFLLVLAVSGLGYYRATEKRIASGRGKPGEEPSYWVGIFGLFAAITLVWFHLPGLFKEILRLTDRAFASSPAGWFAIAGLIASFVAYLFIAEARAGRNGDDWRDLDDDNLHVLVADPYHWPEWLAYLEDGLFEGQSQERRLDWPMRLAGAIPVGKDIDPVRHKLLSFIQTQITAPLIDPEEFPDVSESIAVVAALHDRAAAGEEIPNEDWSAAWSATESATESVARRESLSAAESAARRAAESAARSALVSAAWSATERAARSAARIAARSAAWSATERAARSAARSALLSESWSAARSAAESAAYDRIADKLIELLEAK